MNVKRTWFATAPRSMEGLLATELQRLGCDAVKEKRAGVSFSGDLEQAYRVVLSSRLVSRVLLQLAEFTATDQKGLYTGVREIDWSRHISDDCTFAVHCSVSGPVFRHSEYAALIVKDAVADQFRQRSGSRPSIQKQDPDVGIHARIHMNQVVLSVEMTTRSCHRRGYRVQHGEAPLRENVAAGVLMRAGWPERFRERAGFVDPMCGSGTLVIEAALMAADIDPGILPGAPGLNRWRGHDLSIWERLVSAARTRRKVGVKTMPTLIGVDRDGELVEMARANAARAQIEYAVKFSQGDFRDVKPPPEADHGLIAVNPPYGKRSVPETDIIRLYCDLGKMWAMNFTGWKAVMITSDKAYARSTGLRASKLNQIFNGALECVVAQFDLKADNKYMEYDPGEGWRHGLKPQIKQYPAESEAFLNRLKKNRRALTPWLERNDITCYRLYDADLPNFSLALDIYENRWVVVQEYAPPASVDPVKANDRLHSALKIVRETLQIRSEDMFLKQRGNLSGREQYQKLADTKRFEEIREGGLRFLVNFSDYLDTGIFLDHRPIRQRIRSLVFEKRFLNLFSYTGTASVYAVAGRAELVRSVDASNTYLAWSETNFRRNGFDPDRHPHVRADCLEWLKTDTERYDVIFCDPPTYSVSTDRPIFDIQKDHVRLIWLAVNRLKQGGILLFSTNFRKFKLDEKGLTGLDIKDISEATIPKDFQRNKRIHRCWEIKMGVKGGLKGS
ncbi:MAG: bifunctional 23S rRNA (guanine(2069)-N(7))-methyltransferase RlmK/23S rRNA (guanine(2445)-N(2))-methyltransferase RlmL [bacterium]